MNRNFFLLLLLIILFSANGCNGEKQGPEKDIQGKQGSREPGSFKTGSAEDKTVRIKGGKEILVQRDVSSERPFWCGPGGKLVYELAGPNPESYGEGFFVYDLDTGRKLKVGGSGDSPVACTPDGEWIVYSDDSSYRPVDDDPRHNVVVDLWRYEFATGKRQRFAIVGGEELSFFNEAVFSQTGLRLYLGRQPVARVEMPEPRWEVVWSGQRRSKNEVLFSDSSAVVGYYWSHEDKRDVLEVEVFTPTRKVITLHPSFKHFFPLLSDGKNRLYMRVDDEGADSRVVERCGIDLEKEELSCQTVLELPRGAPVPDRLCPECPTFPLATGPSIVGFDLFSDGETMAYTTTRDRCVRLMRIGEEEGECLTTSDYRSFGHAVISPDERWVAFTVDRKIGEDHGFDIVEGDLYVIEIRKE